MTSRGRRGAAKPIRDDDRRGAPPPGGAGGSNVTKEGGSLRERTPPTGTIRNAFVRAHPFPNTTDIEERYAEFDRWLAKRDAEVAEKAYAQGVGRTLEVLGTATTLGDGLLTLIGNPYRKE